MIRKGVSLDEVLSKATEQKNIPRQEKKLDVSGAYAYLVEPEAKDTPIDQCSLDSNKTATRQQLDSNKTADWTAIRQQLDSNKTILKTPLDSNKTADWTADKTAIRQQLDSNKTAKWAADCLSGKEAELLRIIFQRCQILGSLKSEKIGSENLSKQLNVNTGRLRNVIERLVEKGLIKVLAAKRGNGSWRQFALPVHVYQSMVMTLLDSNKTAIRQQLDSNKTADWTADKTASSPSSSRYLNIKGSTTTQPAFDFESIDLSSVKKLGITASVLARCVELYPNLRPEQLEALAFRFGEFVKDPKNRVQNARGFFISLAEQAAKGQVPLDHIESPDERLMRLFVERQKEAIMHKVNFEREARDFEAECWLETLAQETKLELVPETSILKAGTAPHAAMLKNYFAENVWPSRRQAILGAQP